MPRGRPRQPVELLIKKGKKHLTKAEIEDRKKTEAKVKTEKIVAAKYLSRSQVTEFNKIAKSLQEIGMTHLDSNILSMYLKSQENYIRNTKLLDAQYKQMETAEKMGNYEQSVEIFQTIKTIIDEQRKDVSLCKTLGSELGLSVSSRCRLIMPKSSDDKPKVNKFDKFKADYD